FAAPHRASSGRGASRTGGSTRYVAAASSSPRRPICSRAPTSARASRRVVQVPHAEPDAALAIYLEHLHAHDVALFELVAHALDALVRDLRDVHEAVAARQDRDERAEVHKPDDFALVDPADLDVRG